MTNRPGTYALVLKALNHATQTIGKLGTMKIVPGFYIYIGSAFGPGGLRVRISHHLKTAAKLHWHIDYLRQRTELVEIWSVNELQCEHDWANCMMQSPQVTIPLPGFGASDCRCAAHLFYFSEKPAFTSFSETGTENPEVSKFAMSKIVVNNSENVENIHHFICPEQIPLYPLIYN